MTKYIPFLKCKSNEILALGQLEEAELKKVVPFFDYPRPKSGSTPDDFEKAIIRLHKSMTKYLGGKVKEIYFDTYDIDDEFHISGLHCYGWVLNQFDNLNVIPVVSVDRTSDHINAVYDMKVAGTLSSGTLAIRLTPEDFESFQVIKPELEQIMSVAKKYFEYFDLIFDCRVCSNLSELEIASQIKDFYTLFSERYPLRRTVMTGSSIPASISDVLPTNSERYVTRKELHIFKELMKYPECAHFVYGDYTTVSPEYSDADIKPEILQNVMTAKLVYTLDGFHFFLRGSALKTTGAAQYFDLAEKLCAQSFYRGENYSKGDEYFKEKSRRLGKNCAPATVIKPSVNAHVSHILGSIA